MHRPELLANIRPLSPCSWHPSWASFGLSGSYSQSRPAFRDPLFAGKPTFSSHPPPPHRVAFLPLRTPPSSHSPLSSPCPTARHPLGPAHNSTSWCSLSRRGPRPRGPRPRPRRPRTPPWKSSRRAAILAAGAAGLESEGDGASQLGGWVASAAWLLACRQACRHARWPLPEARPRFPLRAAGEPGIKGVASSGPLPGRRSSLLRRGGSSPAPGFLPERVGSSCALPPSLSALVAYARCHHTGGSPLPDAPTTSLLSLLLSLSATAPPASPRHVVTAQAYAKGAPPPVGLNGAPAPRLAEARLKVGADERELF